jgi:hypothetical protein
MAPTVSARPDGIPQRRTGAGRSPGQRAGRPGLAPVDLQEELLRPDRVGHEHDLVLRERFPLHVVTGDELLGLAATFLARGTAQLVASVVPVPDAQTTQLMVDVHRRLAAGAGTAVALAQASLPGDDPRALAAAARFVCLGSGVH